MDEVMRSTLSKYLKTAVSIFLSMVVIACSDGGTDEEPEQEFTTDLVKVAEIKDLYSSFGIDKASNTIFLSTQEVGGKILSYNYADFEVVAEATKGSGVYTWHNEVAEVFDGTYFLIVTDARINVRQSPDLGLRYTIDFNDGKYIQINSIDVEQRDKMLIGACDYSADGSDPEVLLVDLDNNTILDSASPVEYGCAYLGTYPKDIQNGIYGVFGASYNEFIMGEMNINTGTLDIVAKDFDRNDARYNQIIYSEHTDFFMSAGRNNVDINLYSKEDASRIGQIEGWHRGFFTNDEGDRIYVFYGTQSVRIYNYPALNMIDNIIIPTKARGVLNSGRDLWGFEDDGYIYLVFTHNDRVFMSRLESDNI